MRHVEGRRAQDAGGEFQQFQVVLHEQNCAMSPRHLAPLMSRGRGHFTRGDRQKDLERGANTNGAAHGNPAFVLPGDAVNRGQAQPGAFAGLFRGKERLENALQRRFLHAATCVDDRQSDKPAHAGLRVA